MQDWAILKAELSVVRSTKGSAFDIENRETGGRAITIREEKYPERDGQVGN